jgi:sporulation protein YlmC with PRC-barrel domain
MRATELLASAVVDATGRRLGPVRDIRITRDGFRVVGVVVGHGPLAGVAHAWGYAEGRARGPGFLSAICRHAIRNARFVPAEDIVDWGPGVVTLRADARDLKPLSEELR